MVTDNPASYEALCEILQKNFGIVTISGLMKVAIKQGFTSATRQDICMALSWMDQFIRTKEPIFFTLTKHGLVLEYRMTFGGEYAQEIS